MLKRIQKYQNSGQLPSYLFDPFTYQAPEKPKEQSKKSFWERLGEAAQMSRDARTGAVGAQQIRDLYDKGENELASELSKEYLTKGAEGVLGTLMIPEFATYGALGGLARLTAGTAGSAAGSWLLGKAGEAGDRLFKTTWIKPVAQTVGGFAGFGAGMGATTPVLRRLATRGITLHIPQETFMKLRSEGFHNAYNKIKSLPAQVKYYGPTMGKSYAARNNQNLIDLDTWGRSEYDQLAKKYGYRDWREMILSNKGDYNEEYKQLIKDQIKRIQSDPKYNGKTLIVSNASLLKPNSGITFANTPAIPERSVMATRNNARHPWESITHGEEWWDSLQAKGTPLKIDNRFVSEIEGNKVISFTPNQPQPSATTYEVKSLRVPDDRPITEAERLGKSSDRLYEILRRKISRGQLNKILDDHGFVRPLKNEGSNLRFTKVRPKKAEFYIETDVPVVKEIIPEGVPNDRFYNGPYSVRYEADKNFRPNIFDENVKVFQKHGNKYTELSLDDLLSPNVREYGLGNRKPIRTEKPINLSSHKIYIPETPVQTNEGFTYYPDEAISPWNQTSLKKYQKIELDPFQEGLGYYDVATGKYLTQFDGVINQQQIDALKNSIKNVKEPTDIAKSMVAGAKKYYLSKYDLKANALTDDEWSKLMQTILENEQKKGREVFFQSTYEPFDKVLKSELLKRNQGFLGKGFYVSDIPQFDYGTYMLPVSIPSGKQIVLYEKNGFLHADNKIADKLLSDVRKSMVRWSKKGFKPKEWGWWPGMQETSKNPDAWNQMIKSLDVNTIKSMETSMGGGYKYPEVLIPEDKVDLIDVLFKEPTKLLK